MGKITREAIKQYASSDRVYYRGMRYYAAHAVSNVTWNDNLKQYKGVVKGSNQYIVTVAVEDDGDIQYSCNCPSHVKLSGACKHVIAMMLFVADYQQRENAKVNFDGKTEWRTMWLNILEKENITILHQTIFN